jgi:IstB-like ATP binding protein
MTYRGFLAELLIAECDDRARRRSERRIKAAAFPREKSLRTFDFDATPSVGPAVIVFHRASRRDTSRVDRSPWDRRRDHRVTPRGASASRPAESRGVSGLLY